MMYLCNDPIEVNETEIKETEIQRFFPHTKEDYLKVHLIGNF